MKSKPPFRNLIILLSRHCSLRCPECNIHPELDTGRFITKRTLDQTIAAKTRQQIRGGIIWTGGEPLETPEPLMHGLHLARTFSIYSEILTGGSWHGESESCLRLLAPFKQQLNLRLSLDGPHVRQIGTEAIMNLCVQILKHGFRLSFTIRENDPYEDERLGLLKSQLETILKKLAPETHNAPHLWHRVPHMHSARPSHMSSTKPSHHFASSRCTLGEKDHIVAWDGLSYACCGLFIFEDNTRLSLDYGQNRRVFELLRQLGPTALAAQLGISLDSISTYPSSSPCTFCQQLWKNHIDPLQALSHA